MTEELIQVLAMATRIACTAITRPRQAALRASLNQACSTPAGFGWDRRAAAHAEFFTALADAADDPCAAPMLYYGAGFAYDLMMRVGRDADGIVINSRQRMLVRLRACDPGGAALEMEKHLLTLHYMDRLNDLPPPAQPPEFRPSRYQTVRYQTIRVGRSA